MEKATPEERMLKCINAGVDQFGGEMIPEMLVRQVREGKVNEARIDSSVRRMLKLKFEQGLFDNPFTDVDKAVKTIGNPEFIAAGEEAQRKSIVLLKNDARGTEKTLPLKNGIKVFVVNVDPEKAGKYATVVKKPEDADFAILRIKSPSQITEGTGIFGRLFSSGDLDFKEKELKIILGILNKVPSIVDLYLDRPAVVPEIAASSKGLLANFGASDEALLDIIFGKVNPTARLPFEMPSSMEAVRDQKEDVPYDSVNPLYPFGFGLSY
jgi:beta-glucosidase